MLEAAWVEEGDVGRGPLAHRRLRRELAERRRVLERVARAAARHDDAARRIRPSHEELPVGRVRHDAGRPRGRLRLEVGERRRHLVADVVTSAGVLVGVGLVALTGVLWLDPLLAALTAVNILWSGGRLVRESVGGLMDEAVEPGLLARIRRVVSTQAEGAIEAHDLRTRHAGRLIFIEFHLVVPGTMSVDDSHAICDRIEAALKDDVEGAVVTIHVEPENKAKLHGGVPVV